jgi:hypothetical protein
MNGMLLTARQLDPLRELSPGDKVRTARDGSPILEQPDGRPWSCAAKPQLGTGATCREGAILPARRRVATMTTLAGRWEWLVGGRAT